MQNGEIETFPQTANSNLSAQPFSTSSHDEQLRCLEILSTTDTTTAHGGHDHVPTEGHRVLVFPDSVVLGQAVLQESLRTQFGLGLPYSDEYYEGDLQTEDDEEKDSVSREKDSGLLDTSTVAEETRGRQKLDHLEAKKL